MQYIVHGLFVNAFTLMDTHLYSFLISVVYGNCLVAHSNFNVYPTRYNAATGASLCFYILLINLTKLEAVFGENLMLSSN